MLSGSRAASLASRFILTFYIAKYIGVSELGNFNIYYSLILVFPCIFGLSINYKMSRIISSSSIDVGFGIIYSRALISATLGVFSSMIVAVWYAVTESAILVAVILSLICFCEYFIFDIGILLVSARRPGLAASINFIKSSLWIYPAIGIGLINAEYRSLSTIYVFWFLAACAGTYLSIHVLAINRCEKFHISSIFQILFQNKKSTFLIWGSDVVIYFSTYIDRFIVVSFMGATITGVYTFYWALANGVQSIIATSLVQIMTPDLVEVKASPVLFVSRLRRGVRSILLTSIAISVLLFVGIIYIVPLLGKPQIEAGMGIFPLLLLAFIVKALSDTLNAALYALEADGAMVGINSITLAAGILALVVSANFHSLLLLSIAVCFKEVVGAALRLNKLLQMLTSGEKV